jgi:hypothetical protein
VCRQPFVADYTDWSHSCHSGALSDLFFCLEMMSWHRAGMGDRYASGESRDLRWSFSNIYERFRAYGWVFQVAIYSSGYDGMSIS